MEVAPQIINHLEKSKKALESLKNSRFDTKDEDKINLEVI